MGQFACAARRRGIDEETIVAAQHQGWEDPASQGWKLPRVGWQQRESQLAFDRHYSSWQARQYQAANPQAELEEDEGRGDKRKRDATGAAGPPPKSRGWSWRRYRRGTVSEDDYVEEWWCQGMGRGERYGR